MSTLITNIVKNFRNDGQAATPSSACFASTHQAYLRYVKQLSVRDLAGTEIAYITCNHQSIYRLTNLDLYTRDIESYIIGKRNDVTLVKDTLEKALEKKKDVHGVSCLQTRISNTHLMNTVYYEKVTGLQFP